MVQANPIGFGALLRRLRLGAGLSQEALAERARISAKAVGSLELGTRRAPYRETVDQLLKALNATSEESSQLAELADRARVRGPRATNPQATTTTAAATTNLLLPPTRLIGRDRDVARVGKLLSANRLVTLIGAGGVGKTRVALGVASAQASRFADGVWVIYLAPLSDPQSVGQSVASALGMPGMRGASIIDRVGDFLRERQILLVLDNCEHLVTAVAAFAHGLLQRSAQLRILATSREALRAPGEIVYEIQALQCPPLDAVVTGATACDYSAVELFADRAQAQDPDFTLSNDDAQIVGRIVRRLDGLPLAVELAAARTRALGLATIESRLDRHLDLLEGGDRMAPPRQQTLRALIGWSYDLLSPQEQRLFRKLSVFADGWTLDAAERVLGDNDEETHVTVLQSLASLVDKSLVGRDVHDATLRYRYLESTHAFALEALRPQERRPLSVRHARWVADCLQSADDRVATDSIALRFAHVLPELDNIRAALRWCERDQSVLLGATIASLIGDLFYWRGLAEEGSRWIQMFLERLPDGEHPEIAARLCCGLARLTGDASIRLEAAERAAALAERAGVSGILAAALTRYAVALHLVGRRDEALAANDRAIGALRCGVLGADQRIAWALQHRSWMLVEAGELDDARTCIEEAIQIFRQLHAEHEAWGLCGDLAELEFAAGRSERALQIVDDAIPVAAANDDPERESVFTCNRAGYLLRLGDFTEAEATARDAVDLARRTLGAERVLHALEHFAAALACSDQAATAAELAGFIDAGYSRSGYQRETTERSSYEILTSKLRRALPEEDRKRLMTQGARMSESQAIAIALNTR